LRGLEGDGWEEPKNRTQSENNVKTWQNEERKSETQKSRTQSEGGGVGSNDEIPRTSVSTNRSGWLPLPRKMTLEERKEAEELVKKNQEMFSKVPKSGGLRGGRY
jgi:hypothetical protein